MRRQNEGDGSCHCVCFFHIPRILINVSTNISLRGVYFDNADISLLLIGGYLPVGKEIYGDITFLAWLLGYVLDLRVTGVAGQFDRLLIPVGCREA